LPHLARTQKRQGDSLMAGLSFGRLGDTSLLMRFSAAYLP
jgi:hypothetical protein